MSIHQWLAQGSNWAWPALANHLWLATIVSLAVLGASLFLRRMPGGMRYVLLLIASAAFAVPSALLGSVAGRLGLGFPVPNPSISEPVDAFTAIYQFTTPVHEGDHVVSPATHHNELFCLLAIASLTVSFVLMVRWWAARRRLRVAIGHEIEAHSPRAEQALQRVKSWLGINLEIRLLISRGPIEPGVWGVLRPVVLLPATVANDLTDAELEAVMMHELIHVARWDNLVANLHRVLCCLFWFHPALWAIDRLLLRERERACDEQVLLLGGAPDVYAASLVKVLRFCLGWSVAGASNATGSNLGRRLERIMSNNIHVATSVWHRVVLITIGATVVTLSIAAGLLSRNAVSAQSRRTGQTSGAVAGGIPEGVPGGIAGGVQGGILEGVSGGVPGGTPGSLTAEAQQDLIDRLNQAPQIPVEFQNSSKAPLRITEATAKETPRLRDAPGDEFAVLPLFTVASTSDRRIKGIAFEFRNGLERRAYYERLTTAIEPYGTYTCGTQGRMMFLTGGTSGWLVRIAGVLFDDDTIWGIVPPPPPPPPPPLPPPPAAMAAINQAPEVAIQFQNISGSPLSINTAAIRAARIELLDRHVPDSDTRDLFLIRPAVRVVNNTGRTIASFVLAFGDKGARLFIQQKIDPYGSAAVGEPGANESPGPAFSWRGNPEHMEAAIASVRFDDGEIWGDPVPPPPPPLPPALIQQAPDGSKVIRKPGGVMMASAVQRVDADYPPLARAARLSGSVVVEVMVDEGGSVTSARVISGHPLLRDAAINAARQWKFTPTTLSGEPAKVVGSITFQFEP